MNWLDLLHAAIAKDGLKAVAASLVYSKTAISLASRGLYIGSTDRIAARVREVLGQWECPFLARVINAEECQAFAQRSTPTSNPQALKHWAACQECPFKGEAHDKRQS